jgi:hypothetical protein
MVFDAYTGSPGTNGYGSYTISGNVVYYAATNHIVDASLEDIISPTIDPWHKRENPSLVTRIRVRNTGSTAINAITFSYGVKDSILTQQTWTGNIPAHSDKEISLPTATSLYNMSVTATSGMYDYMVKILSVNGQADEDVSNNKLTSQFLVAPNWPASFVIAMKTNNEGGATSETSWTIADQTGKIVASRTGANISTTYRDTLALPNASYYKLAVTDAGCNGLYWWANQPGVTAGSIIILDYLNGNVPITLNGNVYSSLSTRYHDDFGCGFTQYFTVEGGSTISSIPGIKDNRNQIELYPNPATAQVTIQVKLAHKAHIDVVMTDILGQQVYHTQLPYLSQEERIQIPTAHLAKGMYIVRVYDGQETYTRRVTIERPS